MNSTSEIERLLPGCHNKFSELMKTADGLMLTGSYALNRANESSDIDIIVLSKNVNYIYSETVSSDSKYVQFIFLPYYKLQNIIIDDKNRGRGLYVSMIRNGVVCKDTDDQILTKTKNYLLNNSCDHRSDQLDYALVHQITSILDTVKVSESTTEKIYCASELLLSVTRLILGKYRGDAKHLARLMSNQIIGANLSDSFRLLLETNNPARFIQEVEEIVSDYGGPQRTYTSGWVFTYPHNQHIIIFSPSQSGYDTQFQKYLMKLKAIFCDCLVYGFYEGKNQRMEEGYYLYLYTDITPVEEILTKLNNYRNSIVENALKHGIYFSFPYKTLFHEGLLFGGKILFHRLLPFYTGLWNKYVSLSSIMPVVKLKNYSRIFATCYFLKLSDTSDILHCGLSEFLQTIYDTLFLETVDPNGLYSMNQMGVMKNETLKMYREAYYQSRPIYEELMASVKAGSLSELDDINRTFTALFEFLRTIPESEILLPDIYSVENKKDILILNVGLHIMSIFQLSPHEKFGVVFNYCQYRKHAI